jgi:hypothetical protein
MTLAHAAALLGALLGFSAGMLFVLWMRRKK